MSHTEIPIRRAARHRAIGGRGAARRTRWCAAASLPKGTACARVLATPIR